MTLFQLEHLLGFMPAGFFQLRLVLFYCAGLLLNKTPDFRLFTVLTSEAAAIGIDKSQYSDF